MSQVEMIFYDVQHGNATYIKTPNGKHVMIDLGIGDYSGHNQNFSPLEELWHRYKVRRLHHVTITHPHLDHIDDILNFDAFSPMVFQTPRHLSDQEILNGIRSGDKAKFNKYLEIRRRYNGNVSGENDIGVPESFGGVEFQYFSSPLLPHSNFNNHSIVTVISYSGIKIVLPGDNERSSFEQLMLDNRFKNAIKDADILLAPHHGRESAYHADFVRLVNPRLTIVSDGSLCDTSSNHRYSAISRGWQVYKSDGSSTTRKCLTTNSDGEVYVKFGTSSDPQYYGFLDVCII